MAMECLSIGTHKNKFLFFLCHGDGRSRALRYWCNRCPLECPPQWIRGRHNPPGYHKDPMQAARTQLRRPVLQVKFRVKVGT